MKELYILDLTDVKQDPSNKDMLFLTFSGGEVYVVHKIIAEGIVTWMLANEDQGGYYPLNFSGHKLKAGRPYRHHHTTHKARLRQVRYYFREWFACDAEVKRTKSEKPGIAISMPGSNVRVRREGTPGWDNGSPEWHLEWRIFMPVANFTTTPEAI